MNCEHYTEAIGDLVDGTLDQERRGGLEAHLAECDACRALVADLRAIRATASALPVHRPPDRVWARLSAQLPTGTGEPADARHVEPAEVGRLARERRARTWFPTVLASHWRLAFGGALTLALATVLLVVALPRLRPESRQAAAPARRSAPAPAPASTGAVHPSDADLVQSVESELQLAEQHYEKAIAGLEQMAKAGEGTLDPQLAATLRRNLTVIDQAIEDSRVALQSQPTNEMAQESLFEAFRRKVGLLQDTVALINEMRKGNQAEAAKIIGNMQKS